MSSTIKIPCVGEPDNDWLTFETGYISSNDGVILARMHSDNKLVGDYVQMDERRARALFNWLGVWLHTRHEGKDEVIEVKEESDDG